MKRWIGRYLIVIGVFHALLTLVFFREGLLAILSAGVWNSVSGYEERALAFWFMAAGFFSIVLGILADWVEREYGRLPASLGYSLLVLALVIIIALPASGGWLLLPPAIFLIIRNKKKALLAGS